uniref:Uncharacterized protein n=1 Tax=Chromera velia CCMP2878 TaxID=1169474 RepID=A0A0G4HIR3_9ALVE|eukprot:Cvel_27898.t1-p1 / transcript=Cvel_27898.t1 / gene=Cvel_27898 / organism=Chromera_velia_CCMP2878 / gene_product=hypothetical protein / transcript_product=hypothetical protein / location=Cvel_scaffold3553:688-5765(+) / protein_length=637 / sequence_SO=supercontig / SO=protein_coding / is_pseudo=false
MLILITAGNALSPDDISSFVEASRGVGGLRVLQNLVLRDNPIGDGGVVEVLEEASSLLFPLLERLDLSGTGMSEKGVSALSRVLNGGEFRHKRTREGSRDSYPPPGGDPSSQGAAEGLEGETERTGESSLCGPPHRIPLRFLFIGRNELGLSSIPALFECLCDRRRRREERPTGQGSVRASLETSTLPPPPPSRSQCGRATVPEAEEEKAGGIENKSDIDLLLRIDSSFCGPENRRAGQTSGWHPLCGAPPLLLEELDLSWTNVGDLGGWVLGVALGSGRLPSLQNLLLQDSGVGDSGAFCLFRGLKGKRPALSSVWGRREREEAQHDRGPQTDGSSLFPPGLSPDLQRKWEAMMDEEDEGEVDFTSADPHGLQVAVEGAALSQRSLPTNALLSGARGRCREGCRRKRDEEDDIGLHKSGGRSDDDDDDEATHQGRKEDDLSPPSGTHSLLSFQQRASEEKHFPFLPRVERTPPSLQTLDIRGEILGQEAADALRELLLVRPCSLVSSDDFGVLAAGSFSKSPPGYQKSAHSPCGGKVENTESDSLIISSGNSQLTIGGTVHSKIKNAKQKGGEKDGGHSFGDQANPCAMSSADSQAEFPVGRLEEERQKRREGSVQTLLLTLEETKSYSEPTWEVL